MIIGVPKEFKAQEARVGLTPQSVHELHWHGHEILVEKDAGIGIGVSNKVYKDAGTKVVARDTVFADAKLIIKVKEPQPSECKLLHEDQTLFTYLHLAADKNLTNNLIKSKATCIAYETVTASDKSLPLLTPMSRIAGRLAPQAGANCLLHHMGGDGKLMSGGGGVAPVRVLVIGAGVVGLNAAKIALGMGAEVIVLDRSLKALDSLEQQLPGVIGLYSNRATISEQIKLADMVIGAVLIPGSAAPKLVSKAMFKTMIPGAVLVDVTIDQGGCFATSKPTTHQNPTYIIDGVVHYCVANMPGAVPHTSSNALNHATLPYIIKLASGVNKALVDDQHLREGLSVINGKLTCEATAKSLKLNHTKKLAILN